MAQTMRLASFGPVCVTAGLPMLSRNIKNLNLNVMEIIS
jgi:hypothetical protein